jgi:hypothetical protein
MSIEFWQRSQNKRDLGTNAMIMGWLWTGLDEDRDWWRVLINTAMNLQAL